MVRKSLFTLKTSQIFQRDPANSYLNLEKNLKNSLLFFDEIILETGTQTTSYGDTGSSTFHSPSGMMKLEEYFEMRKSYIEKGDEKRPSHISIIPNGSKEPLTVYSTNAYSYCLSLEAELHQLAESYSLKEISFISFLSVDQANLKKIINSNIDEIRKSISIADYQELLKPVLVKWNFHPRNTDFIIKELVFTTLLSTKLMATPIIDPLHNESLNYLVDFLRNKIKPEYQVNVLNTVIPIMVSDYSKLSIEDIIDLRKDPSIIKFRHVVNKISDQLYQVKNNAEFEKIILKEWSNELINEIGEMAPPSDLKFIINSVIDYLLSSPLPVHPTITPLLYLLGWIKMGQDQIEEVNRQTIYYKSLGHFNIQLKRLTTE